MSNTIQERRRYARVPSQVKFRYQVLQIPLKGRMQEAEVIDISAGGISFVAKSPLEKEDILKVEIHIPNYHKLSPLPQFMGPVVSLAKVVRQWRDDRGRPCVAVKFVDIYTSHREDILEYVLRKLRRRRR